jgi:hypothetical protein
VAVGNVRLANRAELQAKSNVSGISDLELVIVESDMTISATVDAGN